MDELLPFEAEKSSDHRSRRWSDAVTPCGHDGTSRAREHKRGKSAEPRLIQETAIVDDVQTDLDSGSMGTYLVVPGHGHLLKTISDEKKNPSFVFLHSQKKLSLDSIPPSAFVSYNPLSETPIAAEAITASDASDQSNCLHFQSLESVLQQGSSHGLFNEQHEISCVDNKLADRKAIPHHYALSEPSSLDSATNEHLFRVSEEHVSQQRMVSVEREHCIIKEQSAMPVVRGRNAVLRRSVAVSRRHTWSFCDKTKSEQFLRDGDELPMQDIEYSGASEQLLDDASAHNSGFTVNKHFSPSRSKTLPHKRSSKTKTVIFRSLPNSFEEPPFSSAIQSCLLRDYDKDKEWSFVPWTNESENR